ncbi:MAG: archaemetzincin [Candidatus Acidiferrum sp.]
MKTVYVVAIGSVPAQVMEWVDGVVAEWCPWPILRMPALKLPEGAYDPARGQYQSVEIMKALAQCAPRDAARILGVTEVDLAIPMLTFVFGQAQLDGPVALLSVCRLRQEFYGLRSEEGLLRERVVKEALHELGHTFGLTHCAEPKCVMSLATHIGLVDNKAQRFCVHCGEQLARRFASPDRELL